MRKLANLILLATILAFALGSCGTRSSLPSIGATFTLTLVISTPTYTPQPTVDPISLISVIEASDPASQSYDPTSKDYADFPSAIQQIVASGDKRSELAIELAYAIGFPRDDAYLAGQALVTFGPDIESLSLPLLIDYLSNSNSKTRSASLIVLGTIGKNASCAVGHVGPLLWDSDPSTRTAAAWAIEKIANQKLISNEYEKPINPSDFKTITLDLPEGKIVADARAWWTKQGSKINWHPSYDICDP